MSEKNRVKLLLEQASKTLDLEDRIKLVLYPMKYKIASTSLKTKTIRLNKNLVSILDNEELYYVLVHELIHIKIGSLSHGESFYAYLDYLYSLEKSEEIENRIIKKILETSINVNEVTRIKSINRFGLGFINKQIQEAHPSNSENH